MVKTDLGGRKMEDGAVRGGDHVDIEEGGSGGFQKAKDFD